MTRTDLGLFAAGEDDNKDGMVRGLLLEPAGVVFPARGGRVPTAFVMSGRAGIRPAASRISSGG